jgi:TolB-like protein/Flp pilus assembly protein TadD
VHKAHRLELIDSKIAEHDGRIVKTTGDGLLLEFSSVVDAVCCAVDVQRGMADRNAGIAPDKRLDSRIGINLGDIIIDGDDIFGDGVNVAARLEALAEPGGICVSRVVRDQVLDKLSFTFEDVGTHQVKNIARPVEVFRVDLGSAPPQTQGRVRRSWQRLARSTSRRWLGAGVVAVLAIGAATAWYIQSPRTTHREAASAPPAFSIAILPFGSTEADQPIAVEVTRDLTQAFGKAYSYVWVVSPALAAIYAGKAIDPRAVARELNVRYLVAGDLHRSGDRLVVTVTLIEAATAAQLWSDKVEITEAQTGVAPRAPPSQLISRLRHALLNAETRRVAKQGPATTSAMDLVIRGWTIEDSGRAGAIDALDAYLEAKKLYDEALRLDPNLVSALLASAQTRIQIPRLDPRADRDGLLREADQLTSRAMALDGGDPRVWSVRGFVLSHQRRWEESLEAYRESLRIYPRGGTINGMATVLLWSGRAEESLPWIEKALAAEGGGSIVADLLQRQCAAYVLLARYQEAVPVCEKSAALGGDVFTYIYLTAAYAQRDENVKALAAKGQLLKLWPDFALSRWKLVIPSDRPVYWQQVESHLFPGLRKVGVPEN